MNKVIMLIIDIIYSFVLQGDIVTCSNTWLYVWSVNGTPIVHEKTASAVSGQILCCTVSEVSSFHYDSSLYSV